MWPGNPEKGAGKGGKGDEARQPGNGPGPDNKCHECGSEQHFERDCPIHIAKMESKGKSKGKGGGKSAWSPTPTSWNQQYPGPDKKQWGNWFPGNSEKGFGKGRKGGSANALMGMDALVAGAGYSLSMIVEIPAKKLSSDGWKTMPRVKTWKKSV